MRGEYPRGGGDIPVTFAPLGGGDIPSNELERQHTVYTFLRYQSI
jgi:hypothetical protein